MADDKPVIFNAAARARIARSVHWTESGEDPSGQRPGDSGDRWGKVKTAWVSTLPNQVTVNLCRQDGSEADTERDWTVYLSTPLSSTQGCNLIVGDVIAFRVIYDIASSTLCGLWSGRRAEAYGKVKTAWAYGAAGVTANQITVNPCAADGTGTVTGTDVTVYLGTPLTTKPPSCPLAVGDVICYLPIAGGGVWVRGHSRPTAPTSIIGSNCVAQYAWDSEGHCIGWWDTDATPPLYRHWVPFPGTTIAEPT